MRNHEKYTGHRFLSVRNGAVMFRREAIDLNLHIMGSLKLLQPVSLSVLNSAVLFSR